MPYNFFGEPISEDDHEAILEEKGDHQAAEVAAIAWLERRGFTVNKA